METGLTISNGLGSSLFEPESGTLSNRRVLVDLSAEAVEPDGLTIDSQGNIWSVLWGGWAIAGFTPTGQALGRFKMPVPCPAVVGTVLFATICLLAEHFLGGPEPESRLTIAVANGTRHAGLALALATANFPDPSILAAIATYVVFSSVAGSMYSNLYQKKLAKQAAA